MREPTGDMTQLRPRVRVVAAGAAAAVLAGGGLALWWALHHTEPAPPPDCAAAFPTNHAFTFSDGTRPVAPPRTDVAAFRGDGVLGSARWVAYHPVADSRGVLSGPPGRLVLTAHTADGDETDTVAVADAASGHVRWSRELGDADVTSVGDVVVVGGRERAGRPDMVLAGLDADTGALRWCTRLPAPSAAGRYPLGLRLYGGSHTLLAALDTRTDTLLSGVRAADGARLWTTEAGFPAWGVTLAGDVAVLSSSGPADGWQEPLLSSQLVAVRLRDGVRTWSRRSDAATTRSAMALHPFATSDGLVLVHGQRPPVLPPGQAERVPRPIREELAADDATGRHRWRRDLPPTGSHRTSQLVPAADLVVLAERDDGRTSWRLTAFRTADGTPAWRSRVSSADAEGSWTATDRYLFLAAPPAARRSGLIAVDLATGRAAVTLAGVDLRPDRNSPPTLEAVGDGLVVQTRSLTAMLPVRAPGQSRAR